MISVFLQVYKESSLFKPPPSVHLNYIWEWSIHCDSLSAMFIPLHNVVKQELSKSMFVIKSSHYEKYGRCHTTVVIWNWSIHCLLCQLCSTSYTAVWLNQELFEKHLCNQCFSLSTKMNGTQSMTLASPWRMYCMYCNIPPKCTFGLKWHWIVKKSSPYP